MKVTMTLPRSQEAYNIISRAIRNMKLPTNPELSNNNTTETYKNEEFLMIVDWKNYEMILADI